MNVRHLILFVIVNLFFLFVQAELRFKSPMQTNCSKDFEIFVAQNKKLIFQIPGVQGIESSVFVNKGKYSISAISKDCEFHTDIMLIEDSKVVDVDIAFKRSEKPRMPSSTGWTDLSYPQVQIPQNQRGLNLNYMMPYWYPYMQQNYMNYMWPCMWNMFGCNSMNYPIRHHQNYPNGPIIMGKPNIYVQGPDTEKLKLSFLENSDGRFMASTPTLTQNYWEFDLKNNAIFKNLVQLEYLFFDARTPQKGLYNLSQAQCGQKEELLKFMIDQLEQRQFPKAAVTDFKQYWIFKLPDVESCVFPQTEDHIRSFFPIELSHKNQKVSAALNRIYFVVVPRSAPVTELPLKFKAKPKAWLDRKPAHTGTYQIYEWGVGFLAH